VNAILISATAALVILADNRLKLIDNTMFASVPIRRGHDFEPLLWTADPYRSIFRTEAVPSSDIKVAPCHPPVWGLGHRRWFFFDLMLKFVHLGKLMSGFLRCIIVTNLFFNFNFKLNKLFYCIFFSLCMYHCV